MPKAGDEIADKYRIEQLIGVGGMGAVFSARHLLTGKRIALKWMLPELAKDLDAVHRFLREAHAAGRISHPNVVDVYDVGRHGESYFLVMEFLQGEPLTSALARRDLTPPEVLSLLLPAMRGVGAAHRRGVVHRDLKPDNIFLAYEEDGVRRDAKVLDFGISKLSSDDQQVNLRLTKTGAVVGTPYYMAPEQIRGSQQLDQRADVYAFGVILYEALTGRVPFEADTYGALVLEVATGTPKTPLELVPALPPELSLIVLRAMARDMNDRYASMENLVAALEPFTLPNAMRSTGQRSLHNAASQEREAARLESISETARTASRPPRGPTRPHLASTPFAAEVSEPTGTRRAGASVAAVAAVVALAAAGAGWYFTHQPAAVPGSTTQVQGAADYRGQGVPPPASATPPPQPSRSTAAGPLDVSAAQRPVRDANQTPPVPSNALEPVRGGVRGASPSEAARGARLEPIPGRASRSASTRRSASANATNQRAHTQDSPGSSRHPNVRENEHAADGAAAESSASSSAADSQVMRIEPAPKPTHRARSGSLNVNEF